MNKKPAISILTPVWNGLPYLKECIDSVLTQDFLDWELLISDNGSSDGSRAYLDTLTDTRVRIFKQDNNLGIMGNLNFLFNESRAPLCQILCADDYFTSRASLTAIMNYWERAPAQLGFAAFNHNSRSKSYTVKLENRITPPIISPEQSDIWFFTFGNIPGNLSNVSLRTEVVKETGYFDESLPSAGDFDFWSRAARKFSMGVQPEPLIQIRLHPGAASNYLSRKGETFLQKIRIYEKLIERLSTSHNYTKLVAYFNCQISAMHYRLGIKSAIRGRFEYLSSFVGARSPIIWPKWLLLTACLPLALFNNRQSLTAIAAKALLKSSQNDEQKKYSQVSYKIHQRGI